MGRYDRDALRAAEAMMDCIIAGSVCVTPSKGYNDSIYGRIALLGNLSKVQAGR
jgi:hypothetical protein